MRMQHRISGDDPERLKRLPFWAHWVLYGMAAVFLGIAALLYVVGQQAAADARLLAAEGVAVEATVGTRTVTETRSRDQDDRMKTTRSYRVELRFTTAEGKAVEVERGVSQAQYDRLEEGQPVEIFYVPSRPTLVGFEKGGDTGGAWVLWGIGAVFGLVGLGLGLGGRALRRKAIAAAGP
jgi:hypothetical protein